MVIVILGVVVWWRILGLHTGRGGKEKGGAINFGGKEGRSRGGISRVFSNGLCLMPLDKLVKPLLAGPLRPVQRVARASEQDQLDSLCRGLLDSGDGEVEVEARNNVSRGGDHADELVAKLEGVG